MRASFGLHAIALAGTVAAPVAWPWFGAAVVANHLLLGAVGMVPRSTWLGPNLARLPASARRPRVALTFDDGPDPNHTPAVLDLLDRHGATASFFFIGQRAAAYPALVREVVQRGHEVANHSDRHSPGFAWLPPGALKREIGSAQARLTEIAGIAPRFFRPPMGLRSPLLDPVLAQLGLRHVSWTRRGFDTVSGDAGRVLRRLTWRLAEGDVLLLHDGPGSPLVLDVLPALLGRLAEDGLRGVSLREGLAAL